MTTLQRFEALITNSPSHVPVTIIAGGIRVKSNKVVILDDRGTTRANTTRVETVETMTLSLHLSVSCACRQQWKGRIIMFDESIDS